MQRTANSPSFRYFFAAHCIFLDDGNPDAFSLILCRLDAIHQTMEPDTGVHHHTYYLVFTHQDAALGIVGIVAGMNSDALETGNTLHIQQPLLESGRLGDEHTIRAFRDGCMTRNLSCHLAALTAVLGSINLLDNQIFRAFALILIGTLAHHFILPFLLTLQVFGISFTDILHNEIDRFLYTTFTCTCACKQHTRQGSFELYVIDISESSSSEMGNQRRKNGASHSRLIDFRSLENQQLHQLQQLLRHRRRSRIILVFGTLNLEL